MYEEQLSPISEDAEMASADSSENSGFKEEYEYREYLPTKPEDIQGIDRTQAIGCDNCRP